MNMIKALIPGSLLTWVVAGVMGSNGSKGGFLAIRLIENQYQDFYWSWLLFFAATGLAFAIFKMMD